jgi:hypothetical protein
MTKLDQHFIDNGACDAGREWVSGICLTAAECWGKLLDEGRAEWAIWWYVRDRGFDDAARKLAHRWALRAARVHAANAMDAAKLPEQAKKLRALPDNASLGEIQDAAASAASAAASAARWSASVAASAASAAASAARWSASVASAAASAASAAASAARWSASVASAAAADAERKQQCADMREMLSCPWTEESR